MNIIELEQIKQTYHTFFANKIPLTNKWGRDATEKEAMGGNILDEEGLELYCLIKENQHIKNVLQIGTYIGYSGMFLAKAIQTRNGILTTIDPNHPHRNIDNPQDWAKEIYQELKINNVIFIDGYSNQQNSIYDQTQRFIFSESKKENILDDLISQNKNFDLIFIDGNHNSEILIPDFEKSIKLLNHNGIIVLHDVCGTLSVYKVAQQMKEKYKELFDYTQTKTSAGLGIFTKKEQNGKE